MGMLITSSTPAASRTVRVTDPSIVLPAHASPVIGPWLTRPRVGLSPTSPHSLAGMRMEPPPSLACATATMPDARRHRGGRSARRAAGRVARIPGVAGGREAARLGGDRGAELRYVGPAQ